MSGDPEQGFLVRNLQRGRRVDRRRLQDFLHEVASALGAAGRSATVALVGAPRMHELNRRYRGMDKPTDVLAFPAGGEAEDAYLGDIVICVPTAEAQAKRRRSHLRRELQVLTLHGFLHLLGYDHETDDGEMRRLEYRLRRRLGITTPRTAPA